MQVQAWACWKGLLQVSQPVSPICLSHSTLKFRLWVFVTAPSVAFGTDLGGAGCAQALVAGRDSPQGQSTAGLQSKFVVWGAAGFRSEKS